MTSRSERFFALAFALLVVYRGAPALHMEVIAPHGHTHSSIFDEPFAAHPFHVDLLDEAQQSNGTKDVHPVNKTQPIPHCDLEVNPAANPPSFAFNPPGYVEECNARLAPAPSSLTLDPPSLPPRQA
jgi:hypothetical protein